MSENVILLHYFPSLARLILQCRVNFVSTYHGRTRKLTISRKVLGEKILTSMKEVACSRGTELIDPLESDTVLLDTGLDSLSFAMVIATLERELGYDPFVRSEKSFYPTTIMQLRDYYYDNQPA